MMFKKLAQKLNKDKQKFSSAAINPLEVDFDDKKSVFLDKLTRTAVNMKNFSNYLIIQDS